MPNAIELVKSDDRKVEQLYQRYQYLNGPTQPTQAIIQEVCQALVIYTQLEKEIIYPAVERKLGKEGARLVTEALKEHSDMKRAISKLQASTFAGPECDCMFQEMMKGVLVRSLKSRLQARHQNFRAKLVSKCSSIPLWNTHRVRAR